MPWVYVRDNPVDALLPQPIRHKPCRLPRVSIALLRCHDHPRDSSYQFAVLVADGGLNEADRLPVVATTHYPVEPALRTVGRRPNDLPGIPAPEFLNIGRLASDEGMQRGIVQQRRHLLCVFDSQRLKYDPVAPKRLRPSQVVQAHYSHAYCLRRTWT